MKILLILLLSFTANANQITWSLKSLGNNIQKIKKKIKNDTYFEDSRKIFLQNLEKPKKEIQKISMKSSGIKKPTSKIEREADDLVLYDYTGKKENTREVKAVETIMVDDGPDVSKDYVYDYSQKDSMVCKQKNELRISHVHTSTIKVDSFNLKGAIESVQNFEISFLDDRDEIIASNTDGVAEMGGEEILARAHTGRQAIIFSPDHYALNTKLDLTQEEAEFTLPLIEKESLNFILSEDNIPSYEGLLLISIDDNAKFVNIDKPYKKKFNLDYDLNIVKEESKYVLFAGVELGNVEIFIENNDETMIKNIVHLRMEEIFFYVYEKSETIRFDIEVCQKELLASQKRILSVSGSKVEYMNNEYDGEKISVNRYRFNKMGNLNYQKDYLIFKHLQEDIFVAPNGFNYVEIPSQSYLEYLLDTFRFNNTICTVQLNVTNKIKELITDGYTSVGFLPIETSTLDKHGMFDSKPNDDTEKVFIFGEGEGVIYNKIVYDNGSVDYIESFCGPGTYSIEQL